MKMVASKTKAIPVFFMAVILLEARILRLHQYRHRRHAPRSAKPLSSVAWE
jgi:hypothetical protein